MKKLILCLILLPSLGWAQLSPFEVSGYIKDMVSTFKFPFLDKRLNEELVHARLNSRWYPAEPLVASLEVRFRAIYGSSVEKIPNYLDQIKSHHEFEQLDAVLWNRRKTIGYAQIDRLWLDYTSGNLEMTLGRQRIAWGTALVWNVIDLFNPQSILDFDYEEKPGADAIRLQYYTGAVTKVELAAKPGKSKDRTIVAGLFSINAFGYDFYGMAGIRSNRWLAGAAWAGAIRKAGFRGEVLISEAPKQKSYPPFPYLFLPGSESFGTKNPAVNAVLSADYTFSNSLYIHTELLYNNNGVSRNAGLLYWQALQLGMLSPARWSIYQEFSYDITPLIRGSVFAIHNPDDKSSIVVPYLTWSLAENLDLTILSFLSSGKRFTEYGDYGTSFFLRLKYSF